MNPDRFTRVRLAAAAIAAPALASLCISCASSATMHTGPTAADIPTLEAAVARDSSNSANMIKLATAYRSAGRAAQARPLLEKVVASHPGDANAALLLGATYEDLEMFADARRLYTASINHGASGQMRKELSRRLPLLQHKELVAAARKSVANERAIANTAPVPFSVAVFPFQFVGTDSQYKPLGRALAEMMVTDLSQTSRLKVLERAQVQLLIDEMKLGASGAVDAATAARAGHMLGAERAVQGSMDGNVSSLSLETTIVRVSGNQWPGETAGAANRPVSVADKDALSALIAMQKRVALRLYSSLGIQLTPAELARVSHRPTENVNAILAYGRGLQAEDAGNYTTAAQQFSEAARLDPGFAGAKQAEGRASDESAAAGVSTQTLASIAATPSAPSLNDFFLPNPIKRDAAAEILRTEGPSRPTTIDLIIPRGGGQ